MRFPAAGTILTLLTLAASASASVAWLEIEGVLPLRESGTSAVRATPVTWVVGFPDTLAATDTRAILASLAPGKGQPLLPRGALTRAEEIFITGLRAFLDGNAQQAAETWRGLRGQSLPRALAASLRVNFAVLQGLRGDAANAEAAWLREWTSARGKPPAASPAAEGAWRNLITLRMAQGRWGEADAAIDAMLADQPRNRLALIARAGLLWQFRPEGEWVAFLKEHAEEDSAAPDMQIAYGEYLLNHGRAAESVEFFDRGLATRPHAGRGWFLLAEAQFRQGYHYFAIDCLQNAGRAGYQEADFNELYARVLHACCTGDEDPRAVSARAAAQELLEKGLVKDLHRRSMAQLLYTLYAQNLKPDAARELERNLWFHFEGPRRDIPPIGDPGWGHAGLEHRTLRVKPGIYSFTWMLALRESDVYRAL
jgi:hypothetical protein